MPHQMALMAFTKPLKLECFMVGHYGSFVNVWGDKYVYKAKIWFGQSYI